MFSASVTSSKYEDYQILPRSGGGEGRVRRFTWRSWYLRNATGVGRYSQFTRICFLQRRVQDVISPIVFEAAYSLGEHVTGQEERELPALTPVLRWKKGQKIAQKNQVRTLKPATGPRGSRCIWQESRSWLSLEPRPRLTPFSGPPVPDLHNDEIYDSQCCF